MDRNTLVSSMTMPDLQTLVKKSFVKGTHKSLGDVRRLFHGMNNMSWESNRRRMTEVDIERFATVKVEFEDAVQRGIGQGYSKEVVRKTISINRPVSGEAYKALKAHKLAAWAVGTGKGVVDRIHLDMANFLGYSTSASYTDMTGHTVDTTTGDGLSVFHTAHTLKFTSTTYSNILTGAPAFSESALNAAEDFFSYNVLDNFGQRMPMKPNTIITSRKASMRHRVRRLLGSMSPELSLIHIFEPTRPY